MAKCNINLKEDIFKDIISEFAKTNPNMSYKEAKKLADNMVKELLDTNVFGAELKDTEGKTKGEVAIRVAAEMINNPEKHKEIFNYLLEIDNVKITDEHRKMLEDTIERLTNDLVKNMPDMVQVISKEKTDSFGKMVMKDTKDDKAGLYVGVSEGAVIAGNQMSAAEMYVHELGHAAREFALRDKIDIIAETMEDIETIYKEFLNVTSYTDFLPEVSINLVAETKIAKDLMTYLRNPVSGINEFMARAETDIRVKKILDERVKVKLKKATGSSMYEKTIALIKNIYTYMRAKIRGNTESETGAVAMNRYLQEIANVNNIAVSELAHNKIYGKALSKVADFTNKLNEISSEKLEKYVDIVKAKIGTEAGKNLEKEKARLKDKTLTKLERSKIMGKMFAQWLVSDEEGNVGTFESFMYNVLGIFPKAFGYDAMKSSGDIQQIIRGFRQSDKHEANIETLGLIANKIDRIVDVVTSKMTTVISDTMQLTEDESIDVTKGLVDIEFESMLDKEVNSKEDNYKTLINVLGSRKALEKEIIRVEQLLETALGEGAYTNLIINQAKGLGKLMVTGKSSIAQLPNSYMIYGRANTESFTVVQHKNNEATAVKHRAMIDRLATLEAIKANDLELNQRLAKLLVGKQDKFEALGKYNIMVKQQFRSLETFDGQYDMNALKGQHQKINSEWITYRVGKNDEKTKQEMLEENYKLQDTISLNKDYAVYVNTQYTESGWKAGAVKTTNDSIALNSYVNIFKKDLIKEEDRFNEKANKIAHNAVKLELRYKQDEMEAELKLMEKEDYVPKNTGMRPAFSLDYHGDLYVTDLDINIDKNVLENTLRTKNKVETVLAKSFARANDIRLSKENNLKILDEIEANAERNYVEGRQVGAKDNMRYVKIGPFEENDKSKEIWGALPRYLKVEILKRNSNRIAKRQAQLAKEFGGLTSTLAIDLEQQLKAEYAKDEPDVKVILDLTKKVHKEYISLLKKKITGKPEYAKIHKELFNMYKDKPFIPVRENQVYQILGNREATFLGRKNQKKFAKNNPKIAGIVKAIDMMWKHIVQNMKTTLVVRSLHVLAFNIISNVLLAVLQGRNPISEIKQQLEGMKYLDKYLEDSGELTKLIIKSKSGTITQAEKNQINMLENSINKNPVKPLMDAGLFTSTTDDISNTDLHKETYIDSQIDKYTSKIPQKVKDTISAMYIGQSTEMFKELLRLMQYSDFGARYSTYHNLKHKGKSNKEALKTVIDNQINYDYKHGKGLQWLEARGFAMFTTFLLRIQKVISRTTLKHPINVLLAVLSGGTMLEDSPLGDSLLERNLTDSLHGPTDLVGTLYDVVSSPALYTNLSKLT